jgi:hypothetical protein
MSIPAIPTRYRGINFRSRLEAKWAVFFDELNWEWEYEPIDLSGYIPDFIISFPYAPLLVEVKPSMTPQELRQAAPKITTSGWTGESLIVGGKIFPQHDAIGIINDADCNLSFWDYALTFACREHKGIGICHSVMSYKCRVCGAHDGDHHMSGRYPYEIETAWDIATNATQYRNKQR